MTEEESDGENNLIIRSITWRSNGKSPLLFDNIATSSYCFVLEYNRFLKALDDRAEADRPVAGVPVMCQRVPGPPSTMVVPNDLPQWMIRGISL